jgi:hypothetical protein
MDIARLGYERLKTHQWNANHNKEKWNVPKISCNVQ